MLYSSKSAPSRRPFTLYSGSDRRLPPGFGESAPPWAAQVDRRDQAGRVGFILRDSRAFAADNRPSQRQEPEREGRPRETRGTPAVTSCFQRDSVYDKLLAEPSSVPLPSPRRWYHRRPSWSVSSSTSTSSSLSSSLDSLSSWSSARSPFRTLRKENARPATASRSAPVIFPEDNLQLYVRRAAIGLCPQAPVSPQKSSRELLERSYEVLHQTRLAFPQLERIERIPDKDWAKVVERCISAIPVAPVSIMSDDGPFFRMAAPGFSVAIPPLIGLPPTVDGTSFWLNEIVLLTALSILDATRPTHCDFEFRKVTTRLAADRVGMGVYPTSPYPATKSQSLVLVNRRDMTDRICVVEIIETESGLMKAFAREEEDWELGIPFRDRRREMRPAPSKIHANLLQAHIFATCKENRLAHFLLTDTREFVFGEVQMAPALRGTFDDPLSLSSVGRGRVVGVETGAQTTADFRQAGPRGSDGVLLVKKSLHFTQPVLESLVYFLTRAFDITREERANGIDFWTTPPPVPAKNRC